MPLFYYVLVDLSIVRCCLTKGTPADCTKAVPLIEGVKAEYLFADKDCGSNQIIEFTEENSVISIVPPKKNGIEKRFYDVEIYMLRHLVENDFLLLKRWRGVATRYAKNTANFLAAVQIRSIILWVNFLA